MMNKARAAQTITAIATGTSETSEDCFSFSTGVDGSENVTVVGGEMVVVEGEVVIGVEIPMGDDSSPEVEIIVMVVNGVIFGVVGGKGAHEVEAVTDEVLRTGGDVSFQVPLITFADNVTLLKPVAIVEDALLVKATEAEFPMDGPSSVSVIVSVKVRRLVVWCVHNVTRGGTLKSRVLVDEWSRNGRAENARDMVNWRFRLSHNDALLSS